MNKACIVITLILIGLAQGCTNDTAQWRGLNRDGIFHETELLDQWPDEGPELLWIYEGLGRGYAAPAVTADKIYINGEEEGNSYLFALDLGGNLLWRSPNGKEFLGEGFSSTYPGSRSTPSVLGNLVYATSGQGRIACYKTSTGDEKWAKSIVTDLGGEVGYFGYSESVAVDKNRVYCFPGGAETNLAALDRFTGKTAWSSEVLRDTFAYGSPVLVDLPSREILIHTSRHYMFTVDRSNGDLLGSYELDGYEYDGEHCNTPVYANGHIYWVGNDVPGHGAVKLKLSPDGTSLEEVWRNKAIKNNFGGLVTVDDHLYTTVKGNRLLSLDPEDGAVTDTLKVATGSIIFTDNKFICYGNNGAVNLVGYSPDNLIPGGQMKVMDGTGHHFSHPVVSDGVLYIRRGDALMAYQIK